MKKHSTKQAVHEQRGAVRGNSGYMFCGLNCFWEPGY